MTCPIFLASSSQKEQRLRRRSAHPLSLQEAEVNEQRIPRLKPGECRWLKGGLRFADCFGRSIAHNDFPVLLLEEQNFIPGL